MKGLRRGGMVCLAAVWVAAAPVLAAADTPQSLSPGQATVFAGWVEAWLGQWLPTWLTGASETEPTAEPPTYHDIELDDQPNNLCSDEVGCTEGETLPDWDPFS